MGERCWYYIIHKEPHGENKKDDIVVFYDSWSWGDLTTRKMARFLKHVKGLRHSYEYYMQHVKEIAFGTIQMAPGGYCPILHETYGTRYNEQVESLYPENVDSNYGYVVVDIRDQKNLKIGFFHIKNMEKSLTPLEWINACDSNSTEEGKQYPDYQSGKKKLEAIYKRVKVIDKSYLPLIKRILKRKHRESQ